jgi:hypothetical protein
VSSKPTKALSSELNWIVVDRPGDYPLIERTDKSLGVQPCGCCVVYDTEQAAVWTALNRTFDYRSNIRRELTSANRAVESLLDRLKRKEKAISARES